MNTPGLDPFASGPPESPGVDINVVQRRLDDALKEASDHALDLTDRIENKLDATLQKAASVALDYTGAMENAVDKVIASAEACAEKCLDKIDARVTSILQSAYELAEPIVMSVDGAAQFVAGDLSEPPPPERINPPSPQLPLEPPQSWRWCGLGVRPTVGPSGGPQCPPGYYPAYDSNNDCYNCMPVGGGGVGNETPPEETQCGVLPPSVPHCPPGQHPVDDAGNPSLVGTHCEDDKPTCNPPAEQCPPGYEYVWVPALKVWQCQVKPKPPQSEPPAVVNCSSSWEQFVCQELFCKVGNQLPAEPQEGRANEQAIQGNPAQECKPKIGVSNPFEGLGVNWNRTDCPEREAVVQPGQAAGIRKTLEALFGYSAGNANKKQAPGWLGWALSLNPVGIGVVDKVLGFFLTTVEEVSYNLLVDLPTWAQELIEKNQACNVLGLATPSVVRAMVDLAEKWLGLGLADYKTSLGYLIDSYCPTHLPDQAGINAALLADIITPQTWECWTRAINNLEKPAYAALWATRTRPNVEQTIAAGQREIIKDARVREKLRELGILTAEDEVIFRELMKQLPGPSDLVRFMLRDVEDKEVVKDLDLDAEFADKFQGTLQQWATAQGIEPDVMLRYWRAHWDVVSNTQLYEMLHRLRKDSLDPADAAIAIDEAEVERVLGINDVLPKFRPRLIQIAYRLFRTSVAKNLFHARTWDEKRYLDYLLNYGYKRQDAEELVAYETIERERKEQAGARLVTKTKAANEYVNGYIDEDELIVGLFYAGLNKFQTALAIDEANWLRTVKNRKDLMKAVKCRFQLCELSASEAVAVLVANHVATETAQYAVSCWKAKCDVRSKELTQQQLCKLYVANAISAEEYLKRLIRAGYTADDAARIIGLCEADAAAKAAKKQAAKSKTGSGSNGRTK